MESGSTGTRLMQTNAKFTTGKLSTARWLRETPFESGAESASESELELESKSESKAEQENGNSHCGGLWQLLPAVYCVVVLAIQLLYYCYTVCSTNANLISGGLNVSAAVGACVCRFLVSKFLIVGKKFTLAA